jgi:uncharacterized protein YutE (UPF0331/DUF86 family)
LRTEEYQAETEKLARESATLLEEVRGRLDKGDVLSLLEQRGALHSIQILVENAIGKAKRRIKFLNQAVPVSGFDVFEVLAQNEVISNHDLVLWKKVIGLQNAIVHEYQEIHWESVALLLKEHKIQFVIDFLLHKF